MAIHEQSPFVHFDDRAKRVIDLARQRAAGLRSDVIGPEHVLLALLALPDGLAARAIATLVGSPARAESVIAEPLTPGDKPSPRHIRFTATAEEAMTQAARQAQQLADDWIGTEHLLLGLLKLSDSPAVTRLTAHGLDYASARAEIARPEPVKINETGIGHIVCMTAGGWLIQAASGMRGGMGRCRNRLGLAV